MFFKNICILVLRTKVALALILEGLIVECQKIFLVHLHLRQVEYGDRAGKIASHCSIKYALAHLQI